MSGEKSIKKKEYVIGKVIGVGAFSSVCIATLVEEGGKSVGKKVIIEDPDGTMPKQIAVKTPNDQISSKAQIKAEYEFYNQFKGCSFIPQVYGYDQDSGYLYIERLNDNLEKERKNRYQSKPEELKKIIGRMISAVRELHEYGYIHRDIKPENFARDQKDMIKIFDFGLSEKVPTEKSHIITSLTGTPRYASVRALKGKQQSKRDDMEALLYVWLYLFKGRLPWQGKIQDGQDNPYKEIIELKENVEGTIKEWIKDYKGYQKDEIELLENLNEYRKKIADLKFLQEPDYDVYLNLFHDFQVGRPRKTEPCDLKKNASFKVKSQFPFFEEPSNIEQDTNAIKDVEIGEYTEIYKYTDNLSNIPCFPPSIEDIGLLLNSKEIEDIPNCKKIQEIPNSKEIALYPSPIIFAPTLCADFFKDGKEFKPYKYTSYKADSQNMENRGANQEIKVEQRKNDKLNIQIPSRDKT